MPVALHSIPSQACTGPKQRFLPRERIRLFSAHFAGTIRHTFESEKSPYSDARMERCKKLVEFFDYNLENASRRGWGVKLARKLLKEAFQMKAFGHYTRGELQESRKCMERAVELNPGSLMLCGMLGYVDLLLDDEPAAIRAYQEGLRGYLKKPGFELKPIIDRYLIDDGDTESRQMAIRQIFELCVDDVGGIASRENGRKK